LWAKSLVAVGVSTAEIGQKHPRRLPAGSRVIAANLALGSIRSSMMRRHFGIAGSRRADLNHRRINAAGNSVSVGWANSPPGEGQPSRKG
jgi:hypothetical protein